MTDRSGRAAPERQSTDRGVADGTPEPGTPAGYGKRFVALLIDWILCLLLGGVLGVLTGVFTVGPIRGIWAYPVLIAEYAFFVGLFGQTVGMRLARIRCVSTGDHGPLGIPRALLRGVLLCLVVPPLIIGAGGR
ncbi:MAG: RDD family protein, partial [Actinocatenispora sp.]